MAIYKNDIVNINLESGSIHRSFLSHSIGSGDENADRFGIRTFRDSVPQDLSGASCQAVFMNANGANIALTDCGTVSGNEAYITLPQACYNVEGQFCLAIKLIGGGVTGTMRIVDGIVDNTGTDGTVAPTESVPTYQEIIAQFDAMVEATEAANSAIAEEFDAGEEYPAGKYVINAGGLYVLPEGHEENVTWENTTKEQTTIGDAVLGLFDELSGEIETIDEKALKFMASLTEEDDFNDITDSGWYYWTSSHIPDHAPVLLSGKMLVLASGSTSVEQIVFTISNSEPCIYFRFKTSNGWADAWTRTATNIDLANYVPLPEMYRLPDSSIFSSIPLTEDFSIKKYVDLDETRSIILTIESKYTGTQPTVRLFCYGEDRSTQYYYSPFYSLGSSTEYIVQQFRIPNGSRIGAYRITIGVASGSELDIRNFGCCYDSEVRKGAGNIVVHAHRGFDAIYPGGSYNSVVSAAKLGFESCIVIPKFTSDGVAVSFHDDDKISGQMTQMDGSPIPEEYDLPISQLTYSQLMQWSIGYSKRTAFADAKILKIEDFFRICAETGMRPVFSVHPALTSAQWAEIKAMADKYKLTKYLSIKSADYVNTWKPVIDIFGNGGFYSLILLYGTTATYDILDHIADGVSYSGLDLTKTRLDCEFFDQSLKDATIGSTQTEQLEAAIDAGYICSVVLGAQTTGAEMKAYMDKGVSEFTNGHHCSMGLNW